MTYKFVLAYDRKSENPLVRVLTVLLSAEASYLKPVLNTTIEFEMNFDYGDNEVSWVMKEIENKLQSEVYLKIYRYDKSYGKGKIYVKNNLIKDNPDYTLTLMY